MKEIGMSKEEKIFEQFKEELEDLMNKYRINDMTGKPGSYLVDVIIGLISIMTK